jgi:hypothetical protein
MPLIKTFADGSLLEYDRGAFDEHCVYLTCPSQRRYAPRDVEYFGQLRQFSLDHGHQRIYGDFVTIYDLTTKTDSRAVLVQITELAQHYGQDALAVDIVLTTLYAGMVAEERKADTRLGKRVKRLGVHQVVCEALDPSVAANFSKGQSWRWIAAECQRRGF